MSIPGGGQLQLSPTFQAEVYSRRDGRKIRKTFAREAEAKSWRADALSALKAGTMRAPKPTTLREAWEEWHEAAVADRSRDWGGG